MSHPPHSYRILLIALALVSAPLAPASAQPANRVYVDDSPRAWELFQVARQQAPENEGEAIRLYQELLDEYALKLIPANELTRDDFVGVRARVLEDLIESPALLDRYRVMQSAEAERLLEQGELLRLATTRPLTPAGLHAILCLAQEDLEAARFRGATAWLEQAIHHPDLTGSRAMHCWFMYGMAAHQLGRDELLAQAVTTIRDAGPDGAWFLEVLTAFAAEGPGPAATHGVTPLDRTETSDLRELVGQTIWSFPFAEPGLGAGSDRGRPDPASRIGVDRAGRPVPESITVAPTVAESTVYMNDGQTVRALDRFTGRVGWTRSYLDRPRLPAIDRDVTDAGDLNLVAVEGDSVVTLTGHASGASQSTERRVICLNAATGDLRWATALDRLYDDQEYDGLFPHGGPVITEGRVYLLARKVTPQMLTGCYLVALDLATGEPLWIRHVASSGSKSKIARAFSTLVQRDGDLFVATAVGAIAAVDAASGGIRWLRRFSVPITARDGAPEPWEIGAPVVTDDRVIAIAPDERSVIVLDRTTGEERERYDARSRAEWNAPAYLVAGVDHVYAVGAEIRAFRLDRLDRVAWRLPAPPAGSPAGAPRGVDTFLDDAPDDADLDAGAADAPGALTIAGRVQCAGDTLLVPTLEGMLLVDGETGRIDHQLDVDAIGNPLAIDAQLVLAGSASLDAYMSLDRAEQMLRQRLASAPDDAEPALSLVQLGMRVGDLDLSLEGTDLALRAIGEMSGHGESAAEARRELFHMLLEIHERALAEAEPRREALYARISAVADTAEQRVESLLADGDALAKTTPHRALESYRIILGDPLLAATVRAEGGILRPAAYWVTGRIETLLDEHGTAIDREEEEAARRGLDQLLADVPVDEEALLDLAREHPFTDAAADATLRAAELRVRRGEPRAALAALSAQYQLAPHARRADRLLGAFVETCVDLGRERQAAAILAVLAGTEEGRAIESRRGPRSAEAWLAELAPPGGGTRLPCIGVRPEPGEWFAGRILTASEAGSETEPDCALIQAEGELRRVDARGLATRWAVGLDDPDAELLEITPEQILLWFGARTDDPRVVALDAGSGRHLWTTPPLDGLLTPPLAAERGVDSQMPDGMAFDPKDIMPRADEGRVYLVQRTGGVVAFDRAKGGVLWTVPRAVAQVHLALAHPFGLVLAGLDREIDVRSGETALGPRIVVLDAETGRELHRVRPQTGPGLIWMAADPLGSLVCAGSDGLEQIDILSGRRRWANVAFGAMETRRGWMFGRHVVVESRTSSLFSVTVMDGTASAAFNTDLRGDWERDTFVDVYAGRDLLLARYHDRVIRYDVDGRIIGADVILDEPRNYRALLVAENRLVLVSQYEVRQGEIEGGARRTFRTYRVYLLSLNGKLEAPPLELPPLTQRIENAALIDGWLLLSTRDRSCAVPLD